MHVIKAENLVLDMRVSLTIKTISIAGKICQTNLCNNETSLTDLEKLHEFLTNDMAIVTFVNLGTISNVNFIFDGKKYVITEIRIGH